MYIYYTFLEKKLGYGEGKEQFEWTFPVLFLTLRSFSLHGTSCFAYKIKTQNFCLILICSDVICAINSPPVGSADDSIPGQPYKDSSCLRGETI